MTWPRVIGQERVKQHLLGALRMNRLPHAYLFVGNDGVGKDAMAIEFARVLHCEEGGEEACNECSACVKMNSLQHPDLTLVFSLPRGKDEVSHDGPLEKLSPATIELIKEEYRRKAADPYHRMTVPKATIIKINSIREVRRQSALSTYGRRRRVIIISRADEMGDEAAIALLKTLEEPAGHTMLILTTSRRDALPPTVVSRCQVVQFDPLTEEEIRIGLLERCRVEPAHAALVARLAHGSYTQGVALLQEDVSAQRVQVLAFVRAALRANVPGLGDLIEALCAGREREAIGRFLNLMLIWFRDSLVMAKGGTVINSDQEEDLRKFIAGYPGANVQAVIAAVDRAISLVDRNLYLNLILLHLAVQLRRNILPGAAPRKTRYSEH